MGLLDAISGYAGDKLGLVTKALISVDERGTYRQVMFNPDSLKISYVHSVERQKGSGKEAHIGYLQSHNPTNCEVSMDLIFDLVNTYEKYKNSGIIPRAVGGFMKSPFSNDGLENSVFITANRSTIDLTSDSLTIFKDLEQASRRQSVIAFAWGSVSVCGPIVGFDSKITYFSREGAPLRAEVGLTIASEDWKAD